MSPKKNLKKESWRPLYKNYVNSFSLETKFEKKIAFSLAKNDYKLEKSSGLRKHIHTFSKWLIASIYAGQLPDNSASKLEKLTGVPKKKAQDWNALFSSIEQALVVYSTIQSSQAPYEVLSTAGEYSLDITIPFAIVCTVWNSYRLLNRDKKARIAFGYGSLIVNGLYFLKTANVKKVVREIAEKIPSPDSFGFPYEPLKIQVPVKEISLEQIVSYDYDFHK